MRLAITRIVWQTILIGILAASAGGAPIALGVLQVSEFIPGTPDVPGVVSFDVLNLTGPFALPPDFPVAEELIFESAVLELYQETGLWGVFPLGDAGPGPLVDTFGDPLVQAPGDVAFTSARFTASLSQTHFTAGGAAMAANSNAIEVLLLPASGSVLVPGLDFAAIYVEATPAEVPEPRTMGLMALGALVLAVGRRRSRLALAVFVCTAPAWAQQPPVTLSQATSPAAGQPGVTTMSVTAAGIPSSVTTSQLTLSLTPAATGPAMTATITSVTKLTGSSTRISFRFTGPNVTAPATYRMRLLGPNWTSVNTASMIVNPPASVTLNPASSQAGRTLTVAISGQFTNFLSGSTRANFGPGITVGGAAPNTFGPVTVTSPTTATVQIVTGAGLAPGPREVKIATGVQQASATFAITAAGNAPPSITSAPVVSGVWLQPYSYAVSATDPDGDTLAYSLTTYPPGMMIDPATGVISWTPPGTGASMAAVRVIDGKGGEAAQSFTVNVTAPPNGPPVLAPIANRTVNVGETLGIRLAASDPNHNDALRFSLPQAPSGAMLTPPPLLQWTPGGQHIGIQAFAARVEDAAGLSDMKPFQVTVTNNNVPPVFAPQADATVQAGALFSRMLTATDPNPGDSLRFSLVSGPAGLTVGAGGQLSWVPALSQYGPNPVRVQVTDQGGLFDVAAFAIEAVGPVPNFPPAAVNNRYSVRRGTTLRVTAPGVLGNDTDPNFDPLTARLIAPPSRGTLDLTANGSFTYTPTPPAAGSTEPALKHAFTHPDVLNSTGITPLVVDLDRDGVSEIVFHCQGPSTSRRLFALNGATGALKWAVDTYVPASFLELSLYTELASGDLDGDGFPEVLAISDKTVSGVGLLVRRHIIAFDRNGNRLWTSADIVDGARVVESAGPRKIILANVTGDAKPEIIFVHVGKTSDFLPGESSEVLLTVMNHLGQALFTVRSRTRFWLSPDPGNALVADLDLDGTPEILFANVAASSTGQILWRAGFDSVWDMAAANLDDDPFPELIYMDRYVGIRCVEHAGAPKWGPTTPPVASASGSSLLTVGDADGDGRSEILVARDTSIFILGANGAIQRSIPLPFDGVGGNPTVFDLNSDGKPEIVYHSGRGPFDSGSMRGALMIFDGPSGTLLHSLPATRHHSFPGTDVSPVIADVDGDGAAEIVVSSWDDRVLLRVFEAKSGHWAPARPIAHQPHYFVTNVNTDGTIPAAPAPNWLTPGLNNYRVYTPPPGERANEQDRFTYVANDGAADSNAAVADIDILPPNTAPRILSRAPAAATPNVEYLYGVRAEDPDPGDILTFSLAKAAPGMTIDAGTGLIRWIPGAAQTGLHVIAVKVTDLQGFTDYEGAMIAAGPPTQVPYVAGQTEQAAKTQLAAAGLGVGTIVNAPSGTRPAGQVISHEPAAGALVAAGSAVNLVISTGPAAVPVPALVGKPEGDAQTLLAQAGFTASVSRAFSNTVPIGYVISQNPPPSTLLAPGAVQMVVSAGTGLILQLARSFTTADAPIAFTVLSQDVNGVEGPAPPLQFTVTPAPPPFNGALPSVAGSAIVPAMNTRGAFRLTATDTATGRSVYADFSVTFPRTSGEVSMMETFANLSAAMDDIGGLIRQARQALALNDVPAMQNLLRLMVTRWRQVDRTAVRMAIPFSLETGFPPLPSQLSQFGLTATAADELNLKILKEAAADLELMIEAHRAPSTPVAQLRQLWDQFGARAARLNGLAISEAGTIKAQSLYSIILCNRIPDLYSALMDDLGRVVGMPPQSARVAAGSRGRAVAPMSTLGEQLTVIAVKFLVDKATDALVPSYKNAREFAGDIMKQAAFGAAAVAFASHVRSFVQGQELAAVVSGASMSFRVFKASFTMIEGELDADNPENNTVIMIGPDVIAPVKPAVEKIKSRMTAANGSYKNGSEIYHDLMEFKQKLESGVTGEDAANAVANTFQAAKLGMKGCVFSNSPTCGELIYPDGFEPVYTYTPPGNLANDFSGLPVPIVFMVQSKVSGAMFFDTPVFLPFKK